jgi:hypothetical protein
MEWRVVKKKKQEKLLKNSINSRNLMKAVAGYSTNGDLPV